MPCTDELVHCLRQICGPENILSDADELLVYETDAYPLARSLPGMVVFPTSTPMAAEVVAALHRRRVPFVPRGAGTSLAGGCLTAEDAVCLCTSRMKNILEVDLPNECAVVQAGVVTLDISNAVTEHGYYYAPDPSSQTTCTIGGNVANNAGGPHTLKCGVTGNHVLGLTVVLPDGEVLLIGGKTPATHGYDLAGIFVGSEGTLGLVTEVVVKLTRKPQAWRTVLATYDKMDDAGHTVRDIIAAGIVPAALEMMDQAILNILEDAYGYGFPRDAEAMLVIEIDGVEVGLDQQLERIVQLCRKHHVRALEHAADAAARELLWKARKTAFGALGRLAPTCITQDGVVPRSQLPHILQYVREVAKKHGLRVASNFHAGDGNIHPNFLFDGSDPRQVQAVQQAGYEILAECARVGGSVTGEHGIGVEKIDALKLMFNETDLRAQQRLREVFDPDHLANPNKVLATNHRPPRATQARRSQDTASETISNIHSLAGDAVLPETETQRYERGGFRPQLIVAPKTEELIAEVVSLCRDGAVILAPVGSAQQLHDLRSTRDLRPVVLISTKNLKRTFEYSEEDLTLTVGSGMTLGELDELVRPCNQHLPIDPPSAPSATLGGIVACNAAGPRSTAHGGIVEFLTGATMVLPDGTLVKSGAKTVKNVAGYDLHRLFVGGFGSLGVITRLALRLNAVPQEFRMVEVQVRTMAEAESMIEQLVRGQTRPCLIELLSARAARGLGYDLQPPQMRLCVGYEGPAETVAWQTEQLHIIWPDRIEEFTGRLCHEHCRKIADWPAGDGDFAFEAVVPAKGSRTIIEFCDGAGIATVARPRRGIVFGRGQCNLTVELADSIRQAAGADGHVRFTRLPQGSMVSRWGNVEPARRWMFQIKNQFDPRGIFPCPGFLGK